MISFNRNEFEKALVCSIKRNAHITPAELRKRLEELVEQVVRANPYCTSASTLGFYVKLNRPASPFMVEISTYYFNQQ